MAVIPMQQQGSVGDGEHGFDMTTKPPSGNHPAPRHVYGPRAVGALVPGITRAAFKARAPASAQVMSDWPDLVGPALAAQTAPRRLSGGTLTIGCAGPVAMELQHLQTELMARINGALGRSVVQRLRFIQEPVSLRPAPLPRRAPPAPVPIEGLPPGDLHDALASLGGAVRRAREGA